MTQPIGLVLSDKAARLIVHTWVFQFLNQAARPSHSTDLVGRLAVWAAFMWVRFVHQWIGKKLHPPIVRCDVLFVWLHLSRVPQGKLIKIHDRVLSLNFAHNFPSISPKFWSEFLSNILHLPSNSLRQNNVPFECACIIAPGQNIYPMNWKMCADWPITVSTKPINWLSRIRNRYYILISQNCLSFSFFKNYFITSPWRGHLFGRFLITWGAGDPKCGYFKYF